MPIKRGKGQRAKGTGQRKKKGQGARGKGQKKTKKEIKKTKKAVRKVKPKSPHPPFTKGGRGGIRLAKKRAAKKLRPAKNVKPAKKATKARPSRRTARVIKKKPTIASPAAPETRADMVSAIAHEFRRDIMVVPGKCDACSGSGGPQCVEACKKAVAYQHKEVKPIPRITIKKSQGFNIPMLCHNCEEAPCMSACMTGTRRRLPETGWVETDYNRCVGCWMCVMVCPFGAIIRSEEEHLARKCDGCTWYKTAPCVAACKPGAIVQTGAYSYDYEKRKEYAERLGYQQHLLNTTKNLQISPNPSLLKRGKINPPLKKGD
jgi:carbon-monoxide dehydrogenase iron sulfur subunit